MQLAKLPFKMLRNFINIGRNFVSPNTSRFLSKTGPKSRKTVEEDLNLPPRPKQPLTPWQAFVREKKDEVLRHNPAITAPQMAKILAKDWENTDKLAYKSVFEEEKKIFLERLNEYNNSLTNDQIDYLSKKKSLDKQAKALRELRRHKLPSKPRTAVSLYVADKSSDPSIKEEMRGIGNAAKVLARLNSEYKDFVSDSEKEKYVKMAQEERQKFREDFENWYNAIQSNKDITLAARKLATELYSKYSRLGYFD